MVAQSHYDVHNKIVDQLTGSTDMQIDGNQNI